MLRHLPGSFAAFRQVASTATLDTLLDVSILEPKEIKNHFHPYYRPTDAISRDTCLFAGKAEEQRSGLTRRFLHIPGGEMGNSIWDR